MRLLAVQTCCTGDWEPTTEISDFGRSELSRRVPGAVECGFRFEDGHYAGADESTYWLELLIESGLVKEAKLSNLRKEAEELAAIFAASKITASGKR